MSNWIARLFGDDSFVIVPSDADGNCFFHVLSQATGMSMEWIKRIVSSETTEEEFEIKMYMYLSAKELYRETRREEYLRDVLDYGWLENVRTLDQYRSVLAFHGGICWADGESVTRLERILKCRIVLLSRTAPNVIHPHAGSVEEPRFYVLVNYMDASHHFELVTFHGRKFFRDENLPRVIKTLLLSSPRCRGGVVA